MTAKQACATWTPPRGSMAAHLDELSDDVRMAYREWRSWDRWLELHKRMRERRRAIRAAHRRYRRRLGLPLSK